MKINYEKKKYRTIPILKLQKENYKNTLVFEPSIFGVELIYHLENLFITP